MYVVLFETNYNSLYDALVASNAPFKELGDLVFKCGSLLLSRPNFI